MKKLAFFLMLCVITIVPFACSKQDKEVAPEQQNANRVRTNKSAPIIPSGFSEIQVTPEFVSPTGIVEETTIENFTYTRLGVTSTGKAYFAMDENGAIVSLAIDNGTLNNTGLTPAYFEAEMSRKPGPIEDLTRALALCNDTSLYDTRAERRACRRSAWAAFLVACVL